MHINTKDGRCFSKQLDFPKGDPRNPLTVREIEEKFAALAEGVLSEGAQKQVKEAVWNLERVGSVSELMALMEADVRQTKLARSNGKTRLRGKNQKRKPVLA